ncbi:MAG: AMP nucleosidase [Alphaproteobacteria bacterium]|nr:MAG: AMP nucleosidase [Alphaproteobacteria bacterium]
MTHKSFTSADKAISEIEKLYNKSKAHLCDGFEKFASGKTPKKKVSAFYPEIRFKAKSLERKDTRLSYGFTPHAGEFSTTVTRPDIFGFYYKEQMALLLENHGGKIEIGYSDIPMPIHFALGEYYHVEQELSSEALAAFPSLFDQPDLSVMDDEIANCRYVTEAGDPEPLSLFTAPRVDLSVMRLKHYTGTSAKHFQNYVIFTNYQFYIDEFIRIGGEIVADKKSGYHEFVEPGEGEPISRMPQMPAYHLKRPTGGGITMVNIGVGPSNAKTITDHIAVLRPHAWLMLGHCAGLRSSQKLGDYVLAHAYLRLDNILDRDLDPSIPIPALAEIQQALAAATAEVTGAQGYEMKRFMRTGTVATIDDRNWELQPSIQQNLPLSQSRAIALDMESGTIAANGFRFRVPYGTLLCVSDKPLHGQLKLPGMADKFYRDRVKQHLEIGLLTMSMLREIGPAKLHSRKLRSFNEVAFQ